jgi:hypothetical protein
VTEPLQAGFDTHAECEAQFRACVAASQLSLDLFDPDFAVFPLGASDVDAALRAFLARGGVIRLAMHDSTFIERHYPRFMRLLRDHGHQLACRVTRRDLRHLRDSFCVGDGIHMVRRFHSDHMRGEAVFGAADATELARARFEAIWDGSRPGLHATVIGL